MFSFILLVVLVLNIILTASYILKTKTKSSKMLVTLLFSTTGVAILFLLYDISQNESILDIALIFVLLSSISAIVFAKRLRYIGKNSE
ncbi:MAG: hypothetical protein ACQERD_07935 [Campylobacterota bacterium]